MQCLVASCRKLKISAGGVGVLAGGASVSQGSSVEQREAWKVPQDRSEVSQEG